MFSKRKICVLSILYLCASCNISQSGFVKPISNLPSTEIAYLKENTSKGTIIGFINSNGSQKTEREIFYDVGLFFEDNFVKLVSSDTSAPFAWKKGEYLGLLKNNSNRMNAGYPIVVLSNGVIQKCPEKMSPWTTKPFFINNDSLLVLDETETNKERIVQFNFKTCKIDKEIFQSSYEEKITSFSLSSTGDIAISLSKTKKDSLENFIKIISQSNEKITDIPNSSFWVWGKNNNRNLFYRTPNFEVVICENLNQSCKSLGNKIDHPSLSHDGKWLIYDFAGKIYRKDIETFTVEYIVDGSFPIVSD